MKSRTSSFNRPRRLAAALVAMTLAAQAPALAQSEAPAESRSAHGQPVREPADYETIRISQPDGTVVVLRVPKSRSAGLTVPGHARRTTRPVPRQPEPDPVEPTETLPPLGFRISHPILGIVTLRTEAPLNQLVSASTQAGSGGTRRVGAGPVVAGDDPTEWRTGRGWAPDGEGDVTGSYIADDPVEIQVLKAGKEFTSDWNPPGPIGDEDAPGYDAEVIARWDVVPYQTVVGDFEVGLLAFHMNGIDRVDVWIEGGPPTTLTQMQVNPRTGVREFVAKIDGADPNLLEDEEIELRAIAYPVGSGTPRLLDPLYLYINPEGSYTGPIIRVAASGDDSTGDGSAERPFATLKRALNQCNTDIDEYEGARIIITEPGRYDIDQPAQPVRNTRWITIEADALLPRDDVVIAAGSTSDLVRPVTQRLRFHHISLDFGDMYQMYKEDTQQQWYDNCKWFYGQGWTYSPPTALAPVRNVGYGGLFVTDSLAEDSIYAFIGCNYVRNSHARKISGDVFQNSQMVVQCTASLVDGTAIAHHSDLLQYFGHFENLIIYNVNAAFVKSTQNLFLDHYKSSFTNCAFVNIAVQNAESDPPFSQLNSAHDHVLFEHISNPGQRFVMRDDFPGDSKFTAKNVFFRNSVVERLQAADYFGPIPDGVTIDHCHFNYNEPRGEDPTVGTIFILNSDGGQFEYIGYGAGKIRGTGAKIPGYSESDTPDRGATPWGTPR